MSQLLLFDDNMSWLTLLLHCEHFLLIQGLLCCNQLFFVITIIITCMLTCQLNHKMYFVLSDMKLGFRRIPTKRTQTMEVMSYT